MEEEKQNEENNFKESLPTATPVKHNEENQDLMSEVSPGEAREELSEKINQNTELKEEKLGKKRLSFSSIIVIIFGILMILGVAILFLSSQ